MARFKRVPVRKYINPATSRRVRRIMGRHPTAYRMRRHLRGLIRTRRANIAYRRRTAGLAFNRMMANRGRRVSSRLITRYL
jgi:hypothetical protein